MARGTAYTYWHSPCRAAMALAEGAWTDDAKAILGGAFASELDKDCFVALDTTGDFRVKKASASTDMLIGKLISEPEGEHVANSRHGTVLLFGDYIQEVELNTASDTIAPGDGVQLYALGGKFGEGTWEKFVAESTLVVSGSADLATASVTRFNGTVALASSSTTGSIASGSVIPVLMGYTMRSLATSES
jgi:hypothetical protein